MTVATFYAWEVVLQHPVQGFAKKFTPEAENLSDAVTRSFTMLGEKGYDDGEFIAIAAIRKSVTRRIEG